MRWLFLIASILVPVVATAEDWGPVQFLVGSWTGEGGGEPGKGTGAFSFTPDLDRQILVRKSFAEYPATGGKPAYRHDDLTIVYRDEVTHQLRAIYFDNEGHVIHYTVRAIDKGVVFTSDAERDMARYRLTYTAAGADRLLLKFEIGPPGKDFATYIEASARRDRAAN